MGRDKRREELKVLTLSFNPRARVGRDVMDTGVVAYVRMFQSTRPRGARRKRGGWPSTTPSGFNPRARVGRDKASQSSMINLFGFNPRARVGRDEQATY